MKKALVFLSLLVLVSACAPGRYPLRAFDPERHDSAAVEWAPHDRGIEWWYMTGCLNDAEANLYFFQATIFRAALNGMEGYVLHAAVTDFAGGRRLFHERVGFPSPEVFASGESVVFKGSRLELASAEGQPRSLLIKVNAGRFALRLVGTLVKPPVWHGANGVISMGHPDRDRERSFYYSFTAIDLAGELTIEGKTIGVRGRAWFDRQWGVFTETGWDWFSFRLDDGREIMLFAFPATGHHLGTAVTADGSTSAIGGFSCQVIGNSRYVTREGLKYLLGWHIKLENGEEFEVLPLTSDQHSPAEVTPEYWEGLCRVLDPDGRFLGYCVVETTEQAQVYR